MFGKCLESKKGQSIVETALVLPILVLLLTGIIDFGFMFNNYLVVSNASREGARAAAVGASDVEIQDAVENVAASLSLTKLSISISPAESVRKKGDEVVVTVLYDYDMITPIIGALVPDPLNLQGRTVMRME